MRTVRGFEFPVDVVQHRLGAQDGGGVVGVLQFRVGEDVDGHVRFPATRVEKSAESGGARRRSPSGQTFDRKRKSNSRPLLRQVHVRRFHKRTTHPHFLQARRRPAVVVHRSFRKALGVFGTVFYRGSERRGESVRVGTYLVAAHDGRPVVVRRESRVDRAGDAAVHDLKQVAGPAQVPDRPLDGALGLRRAVHGDHQLARVLVVARLGGVELAVPDLALEVRARHDRRGLGVPPGDRRFVGFRRFRIAACVLRVAHDVVAGTPLAGGGFVFFVPGERHRGRRFFRGSPRRSLAVRPVAGGARDAARLARADAERAARQGRGRAKSRRARLGSPPGLSRGSRSRKQRPLGEPSRGGAGERSREAHARAQRAHGGHGRRAFSEEYRVLVATAPGTRVSVWRHARVRGKDNDTARVRDSRERK